MKARGFTLLEVMVAVAILGLALTVILSAQAGLYSGGTYGQHSSMAIGLARCRMTELEERLVKLGYPEADEKDDGECCEDDTQQDMRCEWKVERVELPQAKAPDLAPSGSASPLGLGSSGFGTTTGGSSPMGGAMGAGGPLSALTQLTTNPAGVGDGGVSAIASQLKEGTGGMSGLEAMAMGFVYPQLKTMLEASIRKVTVTVTWKEGLQKRDLTILQYVTRPMRADALTPGAASGTPGAGPPPTPALPPNLGGFGSPRGLQ